MAVQFESKINLGHLIAAVAFLLAGVGAYYGQQADVRELEHKLDLSTMSLESITVILQDMRQDVDAIKEWKIGREAELRIEGSHQK